MIQRTIAAVAGLSAVAACAHVAAEPVVSDRLAAPVRVMDGDSPISVDVGHSDPLVIDWNGDGKKDLLVGQFGGGKLRVYLNRGNDKAPEFKGFQYVDGGTVQASVQPG